MSRRDAPDLPELLDSLEETLATLRAELDPDGTDRPSTSRGRRPPRPPRMRDVLRFTDEYTIPTLVSIMEANVRLLKLAQAGIRAVDPERSTLGDGESDVGSVLNELRRATGDAGRASGDKLTASLSELQRAIEESDTPQNPEARDLLTDAQSLSAEIEHRIRESREQTDLSRFDRRNWWNDELRETPTEGEPNPVRIEVTDEADETEDDEEGKGFEDGDRADAEPDVDIDAELESIREEMGQTGARSGRSEPDEKSGEDEKSEEDQEDDEAEEGRESEESNEGEESEKADERRRDSIDDEDATGESPM